MQALSIRFAKKAFRAIVLKLVSTSIKLAKLAKFCKVFYKAYIAQFKCLDSSVGRAAD